MEMQDSFNREIFYHRKRKQEAKKGKDVIGVEKGDG
jgi:hypothetical protein